MEILQNITPQAIFLDLCVGIALSAVIAVIVLIKKQFKADNEAMKESQKQIDFLHKTHPKDVNSGLHFASKPPKAVHGDLSSSIKLIMPCNTMTTSMFITDNSHTYSRYID